MDSRVFKTYDGPVSVSNRADMFLLKDVFKINVITACNVHDTGYALNPVNPCAKINIYSLDVLHSRTRDTYSHTLMTVVDERDKKLINDKGFSIKLVSLESVTFSEDNNTKIYTTNEGLTDTEMAIMMKYYSIQNAYIKPYDNIYITTGLYYRILKSFSSDKRKWFIVDSVKRNIIIRTDTGEVVSNSRIINVPDKKFLKFYEPEMI
ncbi:MAG: hypothetical protein ACRYE7_01560 [Janthinobacterium lividum]